MYKQVPCQMNQPELIKDLQQTLFNYLHLKYTPYQIPIGDDQFLHAVFVQCQNQSIAQSQRYTFYVSHGFGGSSLMHFGVISPLLSKGNVILWEIRGMGVSQKVEDYPSRPLQQIEAFFLQTVEGLLQYFKKENSVMICHSFSAYIVLKALIKFPKTLKRNVKQIVLLSPIGITPKEEDYKNNCNGCLDCIYGSFIKIGWALKLNYKSMLRTVCCCFKQKLVSDFTNDIHLKEPQKRLFQQIIKTMITLPTGSQNLFFDYFHPRVLPKVALQPLMKQQPQIRVKIVYGGQKDWVDKQGAIRLSQKYPQKIKMITLESCGHNIPFHIKQCRSLYQNLFK